jgi:tetratricopeptide (TPR) repeat protein
MKKTVQFDLSKDRLISMAIDYVDDNNYIAALKLLNKNAEINGNNEDTYALYADIFDSMCLYERCVNCWFKFIDVAANPDYSDAFEGLASGFLGLGQENFAAYYYNKLLIYSGEDLTDDERQQIVNSFLSGEKSPLKFAYPPEIADYSDEIEKGINFMRENEFDSAIEQFEKVHEKNKVYSSARNYIAMCNIICDKNDEAEEECLALLEKNPDNVQALTTLAAVKKQQGKVEDSLNIAKRLLAINTDNSEDLYKIATVCCENGLHAEAYELFSKLDSEFSYDTTVMYFKAIAAYNSGKEQKCLEIFDKILAINPKAVTVHYCMDIINSRKNLPDSEKQPLEYYYRLPQNERENMLQVLITFQSMRKADAMSLIEEVDLSDCIAWCFDESEIRGDGKLQLLGASCALRAGLDDQLKEILLNTDVLDSVKIEMIGMIAEENKGTQFGVVICNLYKNLIIPKLEIGRTKRKMFLQAYAMAISRFAILNEDYAFLINSASTSLYYRIEKNGAFDYCKNARTVCAVIYYFSGVKADIKKKDICAFFEGDEANYKLLINLK